MGSEPGPRPIQTAVVVAVKSVLTLKPTGHYSASQQTQGGMHSASTSSHELAALLIVLCVGRTRPAHRLKSLAFAGKKTTYVRT